MRCVAANCIKELKRGTRETKFPASAYGVERCCPHLHIFKDCPYQLKAKEESERALRN